jgi:hypothetical protein
MKMAIMLSTKTHPVSKNLWLIMQVVKFVLKASKKGKMSQVTLLSWETVSQSEYSKVARSEPGPYTKMERMTKIFALARLRSKRNKHGIISETRSRRISMTTWVPNRLQLSSLANPFPKAGNQVQRNERPRAS